MHRKLTYLLLFAVLWLVQAFLLNNLTLSIYFHPLIGIVFVLLLPLDTRPIVLLGCGLVCGLAADYAMGTAGLNVAAPLPLAFLRRNLVALVSNREDNREEGIPSPEHMGRRVYWIYLVLLTGLHHLLFFLLEALSWQQLPQTALRLAASGAVTVGVIALAERLLTAKALRV